MNYIIKTDNENNTPPQGAFKLNNQNYRSNIAIYITKTNYMLCLSLVASLSPSLYPMGHSSSSK
ncbi:hypothetical protein IFVP18_C280201 [Vibrio parahaemolyticus]